MKTFWFQVNIERGQCTLDEVDKRTSGSFLATRIRQNNLQLFFGCFDSESELLKDETDPLSVDVLTRYNAFSRQPGKPKKHVQNLIKEHGSTVFDVLMKRNGRVYICGKITMAQSVTEAIIEVISENAG